MVRSIELYVHLPFCRSKCRYCDFASYAGCDAQIPAYVSALLNEAAAFPRWTLETVFLGGGTPSLLPSEQLIRLLQGLHQHFDISPGIEFTSEANPGTVTPQWLDAAVSNGVNRLSLGMQAYQPELLHMLGRIHDYAQVENTVSLARQAGITNLSLDLMFGLPGQTTAQWIETLEAALALRPQHLSCYGLIPEEGTPLMDALRDGMLSLPDESEERQMYDDTLRLLAQHGFQQYEISNFALPGFACRHNIGYWRQIPYLGLGASAASCLPGLDECFSIRSANPPGLNTYLRMVNQQRWTLRDTTAVTREEARFETLMLGLRMTEGISMQDFRRLHGIDLTAIYGARLESLQLRGLMEQHGDHWRLTRRGMDVQNAILVELMDN